MMNEEAFTGQDARLQKMNTIDEIKSRLKKIEEERSINRNGYAEADRSYGLRMTLTDAISQLEPQKAIVFLATTLREIQDKQENLNSTVSGIASRMPNEYDLALVFRAILELKEILDRNNINMPEVPTSVGDLELKASRRGSGPMNNPDGREIRE